MKLENITKIVEMNSGLRFKLFENISFDIIEGEITGIVAPIGSGKSTLLKMLAGIKADGSNKAILENTIIIPSEPSSFPWLDVIGNIKYGRTDLSTEEIKELITLVGLDGYENHYANNKSVGFRFRVSLARSLAVRPKVILLDEPFSRMDYQTKIEVYQLVIDINKQLGTTFLLATNNLAEAVILVNKIYLMKKDPLEVVSSITCEQDLPNVLERIGSQKFSKCLSTVEEVIRKNGSQQLFTISI